jgi:hypothetical protein
MMDADEKDVFRYLRGEGAQFISLNSISRHAGGKHKFRESPEWAKAAVLRMLERGILEVNDSGAYRLKPRPLNDSSTRHWVSPQIAAVLRQRGNKFDDLLQIEGDTETYYDGL